MLCCLVSLDPVSHLVLSDNLEESENVEIPVFLSLILTSLTLSLCLIVSVSSVSDAEHSLCLSLIMSLLAPKTPKPQIHQTFF